MKFDEIRILAFQNCMADGGGGGGGGGWSEHFRIILFVPSYNGYGNLFSIEDIYFYLYLNQRFFQTFRHSL